MSCELFAKTKFQARTIATIDRRTRSLRNSRARLHSDLATALLSVRRARTDRQHNGGIQATQPDDHRRAARRAVDWDHLEDPTRDLEAYPSWKSPADILRRAAESYQRDLWANQRRRPEVWIEKAALIGVMGPACERWRVSHMAARGYPSHSELYLAGKRFRDHLDEGFTPIVFYLGDHDPSGLDMTRSLGEELSLYARHPIEIIRLVHELRLPPNPAKETDKRYEQYVRETECTDSWELDALSPTFIDDLIERAISDLVDHEAWEEAFDREQANRDLLARTARRVHRTWGWP
jgi:hypothetical protein